MLSMVVVVKMCAIFNVPLAIFNAPLNTLWAKHRKSFLQHLIVSHNNST